MTVGRGPRWVDVYQLSQRCLEGMRRVPGQSASLNENDGEGYGKTMSKCGKEAQRNPLAVRNSSESLPRRDERSLWFYTKETIEFEVYVIMKKKEKKKKKVLT